ncbi:hypothetical protein [Pseudaestuariivita sp.]|uniref:hypothetical protein n=1 Tax=Pseudaestuariivita sp. TaxID=2211669 RepID=UPI0040596267
MSERSGGQKAAAALNTGWMQTDMGGANAKRTPTKTAHDFVERHADGTLHRANARFPNAGGTEQV